MGNFLCRKLLVYQRVKVLEVRSCFWPGLQQTTQIQPMKSKCFWCQHQQSKAASGMHPDASSICRNLVGCHFLHSGTALFGAAKAAISRVLRQPSNMDCRRALLMDSTPTPVQPKSIMIQVDFGYIPVDRSC